MNTNDIKENECPKPNNIKFLRSNTVSFANIWTDNLSNNWIHKWHRTKTPEHKKVLLTCNNICKYYRSLKQPYNMYFWVYCENEGSLQENWLNDQLASDAEDCMLLKFHIDINGNPTFPFNDNYEDKDDEWKLRYVYTIIKQCVEVKDIRFINGYIYQAPVT